MITWIFLSICYMVNFINEFSYTDPPLHPWHEVHLMVVDDVLYVCLDSPSGDFYWVCLVTSNHGIQILFLRLFSKQNYHSSTQTWNRITMVLLKALGTELKHCSNTWMYLFYRKTEKFVPWLIIPTDRKFLPLSKYSWCHEGFPSQDVVTLCKLPAPNHKEVDSEAIIPGSFYLISSSHSPLTLTQEDWKVKLWVQFQASLYRGKQTCKGISSLIHILLGAYCGILQLFLNNWLETNHTSTSTFHLIVVVRSRWCSGAGLSIENWCWAQICLGGT